MAFRPLKSTDVAPSKLLPVISTFVPLRPLAGEKPLIVGCTKKLLLLKPVRFERVRLIRPVVAPTGSLLTRICESDVTPKSAEETRTPLNATFVAPVKWTPVIVIVIADAGLPLDGVKPVINGSRRITVKMPALEVEMPDLVTLIRPLVAPTGTNV